MPRLSILPAALALLLALIVPAPAQDDVQSQYEEAKADFEKGRFAAARTKAEKLLNQGHLSPELFHFLGNVSYRLEEPGMAALYYRRAALFPPVEPELRQNLAHIRDTSGNLSFPRNPFREQYAGFLSRTQWFYLLLGSMWAVLASVVLALFLQRGSALRLLLVFIRVLAVIVATFAAVGWFWRPTYENVSRLAIITQAGTKAFTAATVTAGSVTPLPQGSEIRRLEDRGLWSYVEIPGSNGEPLRGWVQNTAFTPLWPYRREYLD